MILVQESKSKFLFKSNLQKDFHDIIVTYIYNLEV